MSPHAVEFRLFSAGGYTGQDDDVYMTQYGFLPNRLEDLNPVIPGKVKIQHDDAGVGLGPVLPVNMNEFKRLLPVGDDFNFHVCVQSRYGQKYRH